MERPSAAPTPYTYKRLLMIRSFVAINWLVLAVGLGACGLVVQSPVATPAVCDGVDSGLGGCDPDQPEFTGTTCESVAREFGAQLDDRIVPILEGNDVVNGEHKSVRMGHAVALMVTRVDQYLGLPAVAVNCHAAQFLDDAMAIHGGVADVVVGEDCGRLRALHDAHVVLCRDRVLEAEDHAGLLRVGTELT